MPGTIGTASRLMTLVAGAVLALLSPVPAFASPAAYPAKDGLIAFVRANQIYTISPSGKGLKELTSSASGKNYNPVWNPAGTEIAYEHEQPAGTRNIWVMNANGSDKRQWTNTGKTFGSPAWSPDGSTLLLANCCSAVNEPILQTTSGTKPLQARHILKGYNGLRNGKYQNVNGWNPSWSAGNIAFTSGNAYQGCGNSGPDGLPGYCIEVYHTSSRYYDPPSETISPFATLESGCSYDSADSWPYLSVDWPRWAPNGTNLLFEYQMENDASPNPCGLTAWQTGALNSPVTTRAGDQQADYSPDGTEIVLANALPGKRANIIIESATGSNRRTLTQGYQPSWQPVR